MNDKSNHTIKAQLTQAQKAIAELKAKRDNYKNFAHNAHDGMLICSAKGIILYANPTAGRLSGYDDGELLKLNIQELIASKDGVKDELLETDAAREGNIRINEQVVLLQKDGQQVPVTVGRFKAEWEGLPADMFILTDISGTLSRQRSEAVLGAMIETTDDLIAAIDNQRRIIFANGAFRKLYFELYGADLSTNDNIMSFLPAERKTFWQAIIKETHAMGCRRFDQQYFLKKRRYDIEWSTSRVRSKQGDTIGVALFGRDITHRRMAEETLRERDAQLHHAQKLEAVGTLAGGVAHEFNNALSIVLGNLELASMDIYAEHPVRPYIDDAKTGILRAKKVVRQLLDFSSKSDGQQQKIDLQALTINALSLLRSSIPTHIEFHHLINPCPPVMADPAHIHQLIINLCANGAEAMDEDGGVLTVTLDPVSLKAGKLPKGATLAPGTYAKLTVTDSGKGIDEGIMERIYEPFFTTKGPDRGTGLGLAVVHGIVKSHAGDILASNAAARGAKFEVYLPTVAQSQSKQPPESDASALTGSERILFVDDEPKFVMVTQRQLEHLGYHVTIFTSSTSALDHFQKSPNDFDLVISDVAMPKMTGEKLINQIRLIRPEMPAILCTGYSNKVDKEKATQLGCEYVLKPVERNQLAQLIRKALNKAA